MAEKLEVSDRLVRYWCVRGIVRKPMAKLVGGSPISPPPAS